MSLLDQFGSKPRSQGLSSEVGGGPELTGWICGLPGHVPRAPGGPGARRAQLPHPGRNRVTEKLPLNEDVAAAPRTYYVSGEPAALKDGLSHTRRVPSLTADKLLRDVRQVAVVSATVTADKSEAGIKLMTSKLKVVAEGLQGIEKSQFAEVAREAEGKCPISNALRGTMQIEVEAEAR